MKLRKTLGLILTLLMILSAASCKGNGEGSSAPESKPTDTPQSQTDTESNAESPGNVPEYLNMDSELPIVKEGQTRSLGVCTFQGAGWGDAKDVWFWEFVRQAMNIQVDVTQAIDSAEYKSMAFASDTLPEVMIGFGLSAVEQVKYGMGEKQLLDISAYLNDTYMPNLNSLYAEHPEWRDLITAPDGKLYSLGNIGEQEDVGGLPRAFINQTWLEQIGMETPETLTDFLEMLTKFKALGPDVIPLGGGSEAINPTMILMNAYGYLGSDLYGICLRNDRPVLPYGDREALGALLETMHQLYADGLISQDFFTLEATTIRAQMAEGQIGVIAEPAYISLPLKEDYEKWWSVKPLTSEYNTAPQWPATTSTITTGGFAITNACKSPELAAKFADWFYEASSYNSRLAWVGPKVGSEYCYGVISGGEFDGDTNDWAYADVDTDTTGKYSSDYEYLYSKIAGFHAGTFGNSMFPRKADYAISGKADEFKPFVYSAETVTDGDSHYRWSVTENLYPYVKPGYPSIQFFSEEDSIEMSDLSTVLKDYAKQEIAKFINGDRPLTELNDYFDMLDDLGFQEYLRYYADYYQSR